MMSGVTALRAVGDVLALVVELAALAAFAVWGFTAGPSTALAIVLGVGAPLAFAVVWGLLLAPRARRRLPMPWLLVAKLVLFALATVALAAAGLPALAVVLGSLAAVHLVLATALGRV